MINSGNYISFLPFVCKNCGAHLYVDRSKDLIACEYCDTVYYVGSGGADLNNKIFGGEVENPHIIKVFSITHKLILGKTYSFGSYFQNGNIKEKQPIEWIVLDRRDRSYLLLSRYGLDAKPYHKVYGSVTWEWCTLRKWLNEDFYNRSFSSVEKEKIALSFVKAEMNPDCKTKAGKDTKDKVFLLSISEFEKYFRDDVDKRKCKVTDYAVRNGAYSDDEKNTYWWLRTPGFYKEVASNVRTDGRIYSNGIVSNSSFAVRPALWVTL